MRDALPPVTAADLDKARQAMGLPPTHPGDGAALPPIVTQEANAARVAALEAEVARLRALAREFASVLAPEGDITWYIDYDVRYRAIEFLDEEP